MYPRNKESGTLTSLRTKRYNAVLLIPLLSLSIHAGAQNNVAVGQDVTFQQQNIELTTIVGADGNTYSQVKYDGLVNLSGQPGYPALPVRYIQLIVPNDQNFSHITVQAGNPVNLAVPYLVYPIQYRIPTSEQASSAAFAGPNQEAYHKDQPSPDDLVKYIGEGYLDGNKHIIKLAVYPIQYSPANGQLLFYNSLSFSVSADPSLPPAMHSITRSPVQKQFIYDDALLQIVSNPGDINNFASPAMAVPGAAAAGMGTGGKSKFYEYVIITSPELRPAFEELVGWKRRKGLNAGIVEIQDILSDPAYSSGDVVSGINDDAGKLRAYLSEAYSNGTVYALLGGDSSVLPHRYGAGDDNSFNHFNIPGNDGDGRIPADLYFTDFNGNWNTDNDGFYGEPYEDHIDFAPEIFVGRILASRESQVTNQVHKIIRYERNPGRGDNDYLTKVFFAQADYPQQYNEAGIVAAQLSYIPPGNINIWQEVPSFNDPNPTFPNATQVIDEIKKNYGLVSFFAHGSPNNTALATSDENGCGPLQKQKVTYLDAVDGYCAPTQAGNAWDNLDDFNHVTHPYHDYPHIFYTISCENIPYDSWLRAPGDVDFGTTYTNYHKAGAAAFLGNTRYGWVGYSCYLNAEFIKKIANGQSNVGVAEGLSKVAFYDGWGWCEKTHNLIGCPEMDIWTSKPKTFSGADVSGGGGTVTVNTGGVTGATITVISALDNGHSYMQTIVGATSNTFYGVPAQYAVCITKHNYIPFLSDYNVLVQNHDFYGTAYIASPNDISSGQSVDKNQVAGPVTVKSGGNVFFHADGKGTILLDKGFEVEPQAAFEAK